MLRDLARQGSEHGAAGLRIRGENPEERLARDRQRRGRVEGHGARGAAHLSERPQLAEELGGLQGRVELAMPRHRGRGDLDASLGEEMDVGSVVPLVEQVRAAAIVVKAALADEVAHRGGGNRIQRRGRAHGGLQATAPSGGTGGCHERTLANANGGRK
jgi:hypothetical protein